MLDGVGDAGALRFEALTGEYEPQPYQFVAPVQITSAVDGTMYSLITHWSSTSAIEAWRKSAGYRLLPALGDVSSQTFVPEVEDEARDRLRPDRLQRDWVLRRPSLSARPASVSGDAPLERDPVDRVLCGERRLAEANSCPSIESSPMTIRSIKTIAVFCGSNYGASEEFADGARALGRALGKARIAIVYGGTTKGLMGVVSDAALASGGDVHGVITKSLHQRGHSHSGLTKHEIVLTLRSRKERMVELADAFIALPGGIGTIEELMEVWTMNQLSEIDKPVGLLNSAGFFTAFLAFIDHMVDTKFLPAAHRHSISVDADASALIDKLRSYARVDVPKWL